MITITWLLFLGGPFPSAHESNTVANKFQTEDKTQNRNHEMGYQDRFMHLFDLDGNGYVTLAEIAKDRDLLFSAIDIDGDQDANLEFQELPERKYRRRAPRQQ